jgi:hypothetical protein
VRCDRVGLLASDCFAALSVCFCCNRAFESVNEDRVGKILSFLKWNKKKRFTSLFTIVNRGKNQFTSLKKLKSKSNSNSKVFLVK